MIADKVVDDCYDLTQFKPEVILDICSMDGYLLQAMQSKYTNSSIISMDLCDDLLQRQNSNWSKYNYDDNLTDIEDASCDLILATNILHRTNDIVMVCRKVKQKLKQNGIFIGVVFAPNTLTELRQTIITIESEQRGFVVPRILPFIDIKDAGRILQDAGFKEITCSQETIITHHKSMLHLCKMLQNIGENNVLLNDQGTFIGADLFRKMVDFYQRQFASEHGIVATFQPVYMFAVNS
jgi:ubiquinone/menaquinone biosynthesis C-methylase UbiE